MEIMVLMLLVSLGLGFGFLAAFAWANRNRQFDDLTSPAWRAILDDEVEREKGEENVKQQQL